MASSNKVYGSQCNCYCRCYCRYQGIVSAHPGNVEALRYLVALCQQAGRAADAERYGHLLRRAEVSAVCFLVACVTECCWEVRQAC